MTIHQKAVEQFFTVVLFIFQFYPVCNFASLSILDLALPGVKRLTCDTLTFYHCIYELVVSFSPQNLYAPDPDPELEIVHYERSKDQDDELGISDMKTEGYEKDL